MDELTRKVAVTCGLSSEAAHAVTCGITPPGWKVEQDGDEWRPVAPGGSRLNGADRRWEAVADAWRYAADLEAGGIAWWECTDR